MVSSPLIDNALMEVVTEMADKVIDIDLGASQAQGGLTALRRPKAVFSSQLS
jgi:hypothetical protein